MNHGFITFRGISGDKLDAALREINVRRWKGIFTIDRASDIWWEIEHPTVQWPYSLTVSIVSQRKVEMRPSPGQFGSWMMNVFLEEVAAAFKGKCGDQGTSDRWDPEPSKYKTFRAYWDAIHDHLDPENTSKEEMDFVKSFFPKSVARWPEDLRQFSGEAP